MQRSRWFGSFRYYSSLLRSVDRRSINIEGLWVCTWQYHTLRTLSEESFLNIHTLHQQSKQHLKIKSLNIWKGDRQREKNQCDWEMQAKRQHCQNLPRQQSSQSPTYALSLRKLYHTWLFYMAILLRRKWLCLLRLVSTVASKMFLPCLIKFYSCWKYKSSFYDGNLFRYVCLSVWEGRVSLESQVQIAEEENICWLACHSIWASFMSA